MNLNQKIRDEVLSYDYYMSEPDRCDGCGDDCGCDEGRFEQMLADISKEFPDVDENTILSRVNDMIERL